MKKPVVIGLVVVALLGVTGYLVYTRQKLSADISKDIKLQPIDNGITVQPFQPNLIIAPNSTSAPIASAPSSLDSKDQSADIVYKDAQSKYILHYPTTFTLDTQDPQHIRIYKRGETQRSQSEISDGILVVLETADLKDQSLESFADARIAAATADGTVKLAEPKKPVSSPNYSGYAFVMTGQGSSSNLIIQKNDETKTAVIVTSLVADPSNKGYQAEVDTILSKLELL